MRELGSAAGVALFVLLAAGISEGGSEKETAAISFTLSKSVMRPFEIKGKSHVATYAAWVQNAAGKLVAALLLTESAKYQMKHQNQSILGSWRSTDMGVPEAGLDAVSRATEKPGSKIVIHWDLTGLDGEPVPAGDYVLYIEVAQKLRSHLSHVCILPFGIGVDQKEFVVLGATFITGRTAEAGECYIQELALRLAAAE